MNYGIDEFNKDGILVPGLFLSFVTFYTARFLFYGPMSLVAGRRVSGDFSFLTDVSPFAMISSIPASLILYAMFSRRVGSSQVIKKIWSLGQPLLLFSLIVQMVILGYEVLINEALSAVQIVYAFLNLFFIIYLIRSSRPKDVFSMFPEISSASKEQT